MADSMTMTLLGISIALNAVCIYLSWRKPEQHWHITTVDQSAMDNMIVAYKIRDMPPASED